MKENGQKIVAIIQARFSSKRLPGKILKEIMGKPMLMLQADRVRQARNIDQIVIATSIDTSDDPVAALCAAQNIECYRGSLDDVLDRFYQAAKKYKADISVRLTGDCPLLDAEVIDQCIDHFLVGSYDYVSNAHPPSFPDGLDVEVISKKALKKTWQEAKKPHEREHVTPYLYETKDLFRVGNFWEDPDQSDMRWTVDEPEDFAMVQRVYEALYPKNEFFSTGDIIELMQNDSKLKAMNQHIPRNQGFIRAEKP